MRRRFYSRCLIVRERWELLLLMLFSLLLSDSLSDLLSARTLISRARKRKGISSVRRGAEIRATRLGRVLLPGGERGQLLRG